jgi:plasmid stabilization system protein ParE
VKKAYVIWSASALVDLETIHDFISEKSQQAAQKITLAILARAKQLETFPESGNKQEVVSDAREYRYLVEGNYKIIYSYRTVAQAVYIEMIFDTRYNSGGLKI